MIILSTEMTQSKLTAEQIQALLDSTRNQKFRQRTDDQLAQGDKLRGIKRPEHAELMTGQNNPMSGQISPNRGKKMPEIGNKLRGQPKSEETRQRMSQARKGRPNTKLQGRKRPHHSVLMSGANNPNFGKPQPAWHCDHCGADGRGLGNYTRWHRDGQCCRP